MKQTVIRVNIIRSKFKFLLVNPPVYDFSLYDFWLKPFGLLRIYRYFKEFSNHEVFFFDFLDRFHPSVGSYGFRYTDNFGRGKFLGKRVQKPEILEFVPRYFKRFGLPIESFVKVLEEIEPDFVLITTGMTYWYMGVLEIARVVKHVYPNIKVIVGGIHASLTPEFYKQYKEIDMVIVGESFPVFSQIFDLLYPETEILPDWEVYNYLPYAVIRLTEGCPFRCPYCASYLLKPKFKVLDIEKIFSQIHKLYNNGVSNFAFYDDALLIRKKDVLFPFLEMIINSNMEINLHTPNALHARFIDEETAFLFKEAGFKTIYLGLETTDTARQKILGGKVYTEEFEKAVRNLKQVGFSGMQITAYIMMGMPGQSIEEVRESLYAVNGLGIKAMLSEYSPIPKTPIGEEAIKSYKITDYLLTNCSVFPLISMGYEAVKELKALKNSLNQRIKEQENANK